MTERAKMGEETTTGSDWSTLMRTLRRARSAWPAIALIALMTVIGVPLALLTPVPLMIAVDSGINGRPIPSALAALLPGVSTTASQAVAIAALMVIGVALLTQLQTAVLALVRARTGEKLTLNFQAELLAQAQRLSLSYHDTRGSSDSVYRIQNDAQAFQRILTVTIPQLITSSATVLAMLLVTAALDMSLALIAAAVSPFLLVLTNVYRRRLRSEWKDIKKLETAALHIVQEVLGTLRIVKAFIQEERETARYRDRSEKGVGARIRVVYLEMGFSFLSAAIIAAGTASVLYFGVLHVQEGRITLGQLLLIMAYLAQLYQPLQAIGQMVTKLQGGMASLDRAYALLDEQPDVPEAAEPRPLAQCAGKIEFRDVAFAYDGRNFNLRDVNFTVPVGCKVGIVGKTGAGKSTLINLMLRLFDPQRGTVLLDDVDVRDYAVRDLRNQFSLVLQDTILLSASIRENILYGRPDANNEDVEAAASFADIHDFVAQLPNGYETQVGERGMQLSGGQRQRIAIARAFLKNAPVLILDEPTSSVDVKTEAVIMDTMRRLMKGRTTLMIAHRLSTLSDCDVILELASGQLRERAPGVVGADLQRFSSAN